MEQDCGRAPRWLTSFSDCGVVIGQFKMTYPHVHSIADAGAVIGTNLAGPIGGMVMRIFLLLIFLVCEYGRPR